MFSTENTNILYQRNERERERERERESTDLFKITILAVACNACNIFQTQTVITHLYHSTKSSGTISFRGDGNPTTHSVILSRCPQPQPSPLFPKQIFRSKMKLKIKKTTTILHTYVVMKFFDPVQKLN